MAVHFLHRAEFPRRDLLEQDLAGCEAELGVALPAELRAFLLAHDGPMPQPAWLRARGGSEEVWLGPVLTFFTVGRPNDPRARRDTIESYTTASRELEKLPPHYLCIGLLLRQPSTLVLSTAPEDGGAVWAWRVSTRLRFHPGQLVPVAASLGQLLESLAPPPGGGRGELPRLGAGPAARSHGAGVGDVNPASGYGRRAIAGVLCKRLAGGGGRLFQPGCRVGVATIARRGRLSHSAPPGYDNPGGRAARPVPIAYPLPRRSP